MNLANVDSTHQKPVNIGSLIVFDALIGVNSQGAPSMFSLWDLVVHESSFEQ